MELFFSSFSLVNQSSFFFCNIYFCKNKMKTKKYERVWITNKNSDKHGLKFWNDSLSLFYKLFALVSLSLLFLSQFLLYSNLSLMILLFSLLNMIPCLRDKKVFLSVSILLLNVTQGLCLKWAYMQYHRKIAKVPLALSFLRALKVLSNKSSPLPCAR